MSSSRFQYLKGIVEKGETGVGRTFDICIQVLILISLVSFAVETLPDLSPSTRLILSWMEIIIVAIFTGEYLLRLIVTDNKLKFIFSFYGLIDLLAILPFYVARGIDLRSVRVFRLFRLFRILKIFRYSVAVRRFRDAFLMIRAELMLFFMATVFLLFVSSVGIYYFENSAQPETFSSIFHAMWWAVATLTTVGYGDICPVTVGGKIFTFLMLMIGLGIVAVPTGLISSAMTRTISEGKRKAQEISKMK